MPTTYAIPDGRTVMAATTYTGTGASQTLNNAVNGVAFQPDLIWTKSRGSSGNHSWIDSVRGITLQLSTTAAGGAGTAAEVTDATEITAITSTGFTVGTSSGAGYSTNGSTVTYVGWQWKAGGTAASNTSGSIASSVSANTTAGFSVVTYTGTGANATVGHGCQVNGVATAPSMVICKSRGVSDWAVYHIVTTAAGVLWLNLTNAYGAYSAAWNSTAPTSSVFSVGTADATNKVSTGTVAYCFAAVAGYSAFGSYTGNGDPNGPFVYTGFRPRWIMIKNANGTANANTGWYIFDTSRNTYNTLSNPLRADLIDQESSGYGIDYLSNGFKLRVSDSGTNSSAGATHIYAAFAENPFKYANAR